MGARSRHAKPTSRGSRLGFLAAVAVVAAVIAGAAAAFLPLQGGNADGGSSQLDSASSSAPRTSAPSTSALADNLVATAIHRASASMQARATAERAKAAARRRHLAERAARERAARRRAARKHPTHSPAPPASPSPPPTGDPAHSALGICVRDAEEGGSYVWGPGNGGGAYQFLLSTWERYGGAASEYGAASAAYQDQIFDNAIAAGGASNWTDYDGC